jgi:septal ring factor EnvC (AmiA/AmiB activator)
LPPFWGSRSGRAVLAGSLCVLLFLAVPQIGHAQNEKPPTLQELQSYLLIANEALTKLVPLSELQETRIGDLQTDLGSLNEQLIDSRADLVISEAERQKAQASLDKLSGQFDSLSQSFNDYRTEMQRQVADLERERTFWKVVGIGGGAVALAAIIYALVK